MRKGEVVKVDQVALQIETPELGEGGQGKVHAASATNDPSLKAAVKALPHTPETEARLGALIGKELGDRHPYLCARWAWRSKAATSSPSRSSPRAARWMRTARASCPS